MKKLDKIDKRMIIELFRDGRVPVNHLAKAIGVSKEVALYRLKRLQKQGIIKQFIPVVDLSPTGVNIYRLQLKFRPINNQQFDEFIHYVKQMPQLSWLVNLQGQWDMALLFWIQSVDEFKKLYDSLIEQFGSLIEDKLFTIVTSIEHYPPTYLSAGEREPILTQQPQTDERYSLDKNQQLILQELYEDARKPMHEIAKSINVSITTIIYHLKILKRKKIIVGFRPVLDIEKLGYEHFKVTLELNDPSQKKLIKQHLVMNDNVVYITESMGRYDIEFEAEYSKVGELLDFLENVKKEIDIRKFEMIFKNEEIIINEMPKLEE